MRSEMADSLVPKVPEEAHAASWGYTDMMVLQSAAGYYIGTMYEEKDADGNVLFQEPGSRDTDYIRTREEAEKLLASEMFETREHP